MIMQRLKQETQVYHTALETTPLSAGLMSNTLTADGYCRLLQKFYGFHLLLEAALGRFDWATVGFNFEQRRKVHYLEQDLALLGVHPQQVAVCQALPTLDTMAQALGCLYVMEGSTLGGQIITRHLRQQLPLEQYHYFYSYGDQVGSMWKSFGQLATQYATTVALEDEIVASAAETFIKLQAWLEA